MESFRLRSEFFVPLNEDIFDLLEKKLQPGLLSFIMETNNLKPAAVDEQIVWDLFKPVTPIEYWLLLKNCSHQNGR